MRLLQFSYFLKFHVHSVKPSFELAVHCVGVVLPSMKFSMERRVVIRLARFSCKSKLGLKVTLMGNWLSHSVVLRSVGRRPVRWMTDLLKAAGSTWMQAASNRCKWRSMGDVYVQQGTCNGSFNDDDDDEIIRKYWIWFVSFVSLTKKYESIASKSSTLSNSVSSWELTPLTPGLPEFDLLHLCIFFLSEK